MLEGDEEGVNLRQCGALRGFQLFHHRHQTGEFALEVKGRESSVGGAVGEWDGRVRREGGVFPDGLPAGERGHPEDVLRGVVIAVFELGGNGRGVGGVGVVVGAVEEVVVRRIFERGFEFLAAEVEGVGNVFEKDEAEDGVLIDGGVEVGAKPVGGVPELFIKRFEKLLFLLSVGLRHGVDGMMKIEWQRIAQKSRMQTGTSPRFFMKSLFADSIFFRAIPDGPKPVQSRCEGCINIAD